MITATAVAGAMRREPPARDRSDAPSDLHIGARSVSRFEQDGAPGNHDEPLVGILKTFGLPRSAAGGRDRPGVHRRDHRVGVRALASELL